MLATLCLGDRVRIGPRVSPRYLASLDGTIVELDDHAATVQLDFPVGRFESGRVRCPPLALEKPGTPVFQRPKAHRHAVGVFGDRESRAGPRGYQPLFKTSGGARQRSEN
jgi:hypothetical protein